RILQLPCPYSMPCDAVWFRSVEAFARLPVGRLIALEVDGCPIGQTAQRADDDIAEDRHPNVRAGDDFRTGDCTRRTKRTDDCSKPRLGGAADEKASDVSEHVSSFQSCG